MQLLQTRVRVLILSTFLLSTVPTLSQAQATQRGRDGDQSIRTSQLDNEDHETSFDWVGFFGLLGLVGLIGPKRKRDQQAQATR